MYKMLKKLMRKIKITFKNFLFLFICFLIANLKNKNKYNLRLKWKKNTIKAN